VEAVRRGADDFVSWPLRAERLLGVLERLTGVDRVACPWHVDHASARWASIVAPLVKAPMDPRTLQLWSRWVAASPGTIRGWCGTAGISTKASLDLGRMLRVVATGRGDRRSLTDLLDLVDKRTLAVMLRLGAPASTVPAPLPRTIDELLARQQWVRKSAAVDALRSRLETQRCLSSGGEPRERQLASVRGYTVRAEVDWAHEPGNRRRTPRGLTA
jgi:hypothetical protein